MNEHKMPSLATSAQIDENSRRPLKKKKVIVKKKTRRRGTNTSTTTTATTTTTVSSSNRIPRLSMSCKKRPLFDFNRTAMIMNYESLLSGEKYN